MAHKIVAFGASSSTKSINKKLATFAANQLDNAEIQILDLNDFEMPIYSMDREEASGVPELAVTFKSHLKGADGIIISFAEHNGAYAAAFKNIYDWVSRIDNDVWMSKPLFLMATSPGGRGGKTVLDIAVAKFSFGYKNTIVSFSLPSFQNNFSSVDGITDETLNVDFRAQLGVFERAL